jgi:two-component system chemotaxis sensor kinase CheA
VDKCFIVVAKDGEKSIGVVVDELMEQQEFVVKPLGKFLVDIRGIAGATILGDGQVGLILDVPALIKMATP